MDKRSKIIEGIIDIADRNYPDSEIFLYGSRARGDNGTESDWDLLVLLDENNVSFERETKIMDDYYDLELKTGEVFSPLIYAKNDWATNYLFSPLHQTIEQEGLKIR